MKPLYNRTISVGTKFASSGHAWLAAAMLALMFGLGITSMMGDSAIVDEAAHIPAAYSYLHYADYRLNPEHPPLIKDLAGIPLQFIHVKFPVDRAPWTTEPNGEWGVGWDFLYHLGNNAGEILFWARLPILLLAIGFGIIIYRYVLRRWGKAAALLSLLFYTLSPNILAHARYVTTDLGASVFMFLALITFARYVERPFRNNMLLLSFALAGAQLAKFSSVLLFPFLAVVAIIIANIWPEPERFAARLKTYLGGLALASVLSLIYIWIVYYFQTLNMPLDVQDRLIYHSLPTIYAQPIANFLAYINNFPLMKGLTQYLLGVTMVFGRVAGGNVTYLNGHVHNGAYLAYFPELFVVKTQISFLILGVVTAIFGLKRLFGYKPFKLWSIWAASIRKYFVEWLLGAFAAFYFAFAMAGNLNLGIRHILPIYIPLFIVVAIATVRLMRRFVRSKWRVGSQLSLIVLLIWYSAATILAYPHYVSYFNELIGGPTNAEYYFSDSGVDWGQDLIRLKQFTVDNHIEHMAIDYFGGADVRYYFCARKYDSHGDLIDTAEGYNCTGSVYEPWHSYNNKYQGQYITVSETFLENDPYTHAQVGGSGYQYLRDMKPYARVGNSIYVYKLY